MELELLDFLLQNLLIETAQRVPDKTAVKMGSETLTYGELDELSNKLARTLLESGCKRGDRVAIFMPKSLWGIVAIHGILKAGCVYVPLDARAPHNRLAFILRDCDVQCILALETGIEALRRIFAQTKLSPRSVVTLGSNPRSEPIEGTRQISWSEVLACPDSQSPPSRTIETDLAYLLYTSGSTGVPKGVMITHLNSLTFIRWAHNCLGVQSDDKVSGHAPLHFDLSTFDVFASFKAGATLFPVPEGISTFPVSFANWLADNEISVSYLVPSALSNMVRHGEFEAHDFANLRMVLFAGEVFPVRYLRAWMNKVPDAEFYNLYGPTETNVITYYKVGKLPDDQETPVPIGKACANMEVWSVASDGRVITETGIEGELLARGSCVAQGYWGDAKKTEAVFQSNTTSPYLKDLEYRTGDIVVLDDEDNYVYVGRRDHMVKRRGYRIELGEIETALYSQEAVSEAAVIASPDEASGNRIEAYVVVSDNTTPSELMREISGTLPKYMLPDSLELLESLPKTSSGKTDRRALMESAATGSGPA